LIWESQFRFLSPESKSLIPSRIPSGTKIESLVNLTENEARIKAVDFLNKLNFKITSSDLKLIALSPYSICNSEIFSTKYTFAFGENVKGTIYREASKGYISVDAFTGKISHFSSPKPGKLDSKINKDKPLEIAISIAQENQTDLKRKGFHFEKEKHSLPGYYRFSWELVDPEAQIKLPHCVDIMVGFNGEIFEYNESFIPITISLTPKITKDEAEKIAISDIVKRFNFEKKFIKLRNPPPCLMIGSNPPEQVGAKQTLVWVLYFERSQPNKLIYNLSYIIDAYTGEILKAEVFKRPVDVL